MQLFYFILFFQQSGLSTRLRPVWRQIITKTVCPRCVHVSPAGTAISLHPVGLRLHLLQPGDSSLEGEDLLLHREQCESLCCLLAKTAISVHVGTLSLLYVATAKKCHTQRQGDALRSYPAEAQIV